MEKYFRYLVPINKILLQAISILSVIKNFYTQICISVMRIFSQ